MKLCIYPVMGMWPKNILNTHTLDTMLNIQCENILLANPVLQNNLKILVKSLKFVVRYRNLSAI